MKKIGYYVQMAWLILLIETLAAASLALLDDPKIKRYIEEKEKMQNSMNSLFIKNKLYVRDVKVDTSADASLYLYFVFTTFEETKSKTEAQWKKQIDEFGRKITEYNRVMVNMKIKHEKISSSGPLDREEDFDKSLVKEVEEMAKEFLRDAQREKKNPTGMATRKEERKIEEIVRKIRDKKSKKVSFLQILKYLGENSRKNGHLNRFEITIPQEMFFFYRMHDVVSLVQKGVLSQVVEIVVQAVYNIVYNLENRRVYKLVGQIALRAYSHRIDIGGEEYLLVQREKEVSYEINYIMKRATAQRPSYYELAGIWMVSNVDKSKTFLEDVALTCVPKDFVNSSLCNHKIWEILFKSSAQSKKKPIIRLLSIPCVFSKDGNGDSVISRMLIGSERAHNTVIRFTIQSLEDDSSIQSASSSVHPVQSDLSILSHGSSSLPGEDVVGNSSIRDTLLRKYATIKVVAIRNYATLKDITIQKPEFIKIKVISFTRTITSLCTKEAGFDGSLLSFIRRYLTFQEVLEFRISLDTYTKHVIEKTDFTIHAATKEEKRGMVFEDLKKWGYKGDFRCRHTILSVSQEDLRKERKRPCSETPEKGKKKKLL